MDAATPLIEALGWTLVHFLWEGAVLAAVLWLVLRGMRRACAVWRYAAAALVMGAMLVAAAATLVWQWPAAPEKRVSPSAGGIQGPGAAAMTGNAINTLPGPPAVDPLDRAVRSDAPWIPGLVARPVVGEPAGLAIRPWFPWIVGGWAAGVLVVLGRLGHGWWWLRRVRLGSVAVGIGRWNERLLEIARVLRVSRPVRLLSSATARVPMVVGWLKPVVIVPAALFAGLPAAQLEAILAHELAHIRRRDFLVNLLQCLVEALLFYHPAVWWVSGQVRKEREHCCDDIAASLCGGALPYARALTALEEFRGTESLLGVAASGRPLLERIRRLLGVRESATLGWPAAATLIVLALVPLGLVFGGAKPAFVAPQAAHIGDADWSSYCVHAGGETQFVFLTKGDFSSSTRSHHNAVARTWQNDGTLRFPEGREVSFRRSHETPDTLVVEDSQPTARFRFEAATPTDPIIDAADEPGFQQGLVMTLPLFGLGQEEVKVEGDRITYTFSLSKGRVLLLDEVTPGIHLLNVPVKPITSAESLAAARSLVESARAAQATAHPGIWVFPGGVTVRLYGEVVHATDVMTTALITWPGREGRGPAQWHTGIAGDAFANREKWAVGWEKDTPVLWVASRSLGSAEQAPDGRPVANRYKRIDFSDPSHIREESFQDGWPEVDGPPASVVTQMAAIIEARGGGKTASTLHSWASAGAAEKIDLPAVQNIHLTLSPEGVMTLEVQELKQTCRPEAVANTLAALRAEWTAKRGASLAGKSIIPRVTVSVPPGLAPAAIEAMIRAACVEAGCGPWAAGSVRSTGGVRRFESGGYHGVVLEPVGAAPIYLVAPKAYDLSVDATALQGILTFPVATTAKELRLRYGWDPARPALLTLRNHDYEEQLNDLSRGRILWVMFDRHEFNAALYQVPGEAGTGTDEASLAAVVARARAWWDKANERTRWEQSRVVVPDSGYYAGQPLDATADAIVWGEPNESGLRLGLGGLKPGARVPAGQPLPLKQYIRNDGAKTIRLSATGPFNEGLEGTLRRLDGGRFTRTGIPHIANYRWPMVAIRARLEPGQFIELQSRPLQTVYANPDGSASGALLGYDSGFIVKPGDYVLELVHHIGRFHGAPANTFTGNPSLAPGLGEWTGTLSAAPLSVEITEPAIGTAKPGDVREDRGLDRLQFKPDRLVLSHPAPGKTGSHSYIVDSDGNWPTAAGEWPIARPDDGYLAAWDEGNRRLWIANGPTVHKLDLTDGTLRDAGSWPATTPADGYGDMPPGVREALGLPRAGGATRVAEPDGVSASAPAENPLTTPDLSEEDALRLATETAVGFFKTDDLKSRLQVLDVSADERDTVAAFLQRHPLAADLGATVVEAPPGEPDFVSPSRRPDGGWEVKVAIETPQSGLTHFFRVRVTGREARLNWESSTVRQAGLFEDMAAGQAGDTHTVWATVKRGDYFNRAYSDESRFSCYELSVPQVERRFFGYVAKGSLLDQALVAAMGPAEVSLTTPLVVTVPQADRDERQLEIVSAREAEAALRSTVAAPPVAGFGIRLVSEEAGPATERLPEKPARGGQDTFLHVEKEIAISPADVASAAAEGPAAGRTDWTILIELTPEAGVRFEEFTGRHIGRRLAIVVDGVVLMSPTVLAPIGRSIAISGNFTEVAAKRAAQAIQPPQEDKEGSASGPVPSEPDAPESDGPAHRLKVMESQGLQPLRHFRVLAGVPSGVSSEFEKARNVEVITWQPHTLREGTNGELLWPLERSYDKMALRVEADGFVPQVFSWLEQTKGAQELTFQMVDDAGVRGRVMTPENRRPAHDATVVLAMIGRGARLTGTTFPELQIKADPSSPREAWERPVVVTPDANGGFSLPNEIDPTAMVLFLHGDGVLEMSYAAWKAQPNVTLQSWGRLHGRVQWGGAPGAGEKVALIAHHGDLYGYPDILSQSDETMANEDGVFVFQRVLPGLCQLSCPIIPDPGNAAGFTAINLDGRLTHTTVAPGPAITPVVIGGVGRAVKGRLSGRASYDDITIHLHPTAPHIGLPGDDEIWKAWNAFQASPEGRLFFREGLKVAADGTFDIPAVLPGSYQVFFAAPGADAPVAFSSLLVPPEHRDHAPEAMDLGEIKAQP